MNQLFKHNDSLKFAIETADAIFLKEMINLDSIDAVLRECLTLEEMREAGSFFTGQELASKIIKAFGKAITDTSVVLDPTCGAGNLLIECSRMLGVKETLSETLENWGKVLWGSDIHASFIEATKLRLVIEALNRGVKKDCSVDKALLFFKNIKVEDALNLNKQDLLNVTHVVMNPPFSMWQSPNKYYWNKGKVNAAGVVFDYYLRILPKGCLISAILPDVLRSGSRYELFRKFCSLNLSADCSIWGRFNSKTDVDVFILSGYLMDNQGDHEVAWQESLENIPRLSDFFDVCVGPLVAYRDLKVGDEYPYFHSKNTPAWETITEADEVRKFKGKVINPPFVVVKRTSSPSDKFRATATLINLKSLVAIENHLIVIKPKSNSLRDCKKIMKALRSTDINIFLNKRIRLRHLTVQVLKDIPLKDEY